MKEGKNIKKFIFSFYGIMLLCIILFNLILFPSIKESRIKEVGYDQFITMTTSGEIGEITIEKLTKFIDTNKGDKENEIHGIIQSTCG